MKKLVTAVVLLLASAGITYSQSKIVTDFKPVCDSLSVLIQERSSVKGHLELKAVMKRGNILDFYFTQSLGDYPWYGNDIPWFKRELKNLFPE